MSQTTKPEEMEKVFCTTCSGSGEETVLGLGEDTGEYRCSTCGGLGYIWRKKS